MKAYLTRRYTFPASHRLHSAALDEAANRETYGKCNNPHGHGHNYSLEITMSGTVDGETGMVCDLAVLDGFVRDEILARYDHANLNKCSQFEGLVPTSENLCIAIYDIVAEGFRAATLDKVRLEETSKNSFEYAGGREFRN